MNVQNLVLFCQFILKILSKNQILTSIKDRNSVVYLRNAMMFMTKLDLVNDDMYTKLVLIGLLVFKILSKNSFLTLIKGRYSVANLPKFANSVVCGRIWPNFKLIQARIHVCHHYL